jgi:hypothetical protein
LILHIEFLVFPGFRLPCLVLVKMVGTRLGKQAAGRKPGQNQIEASGRGDHQKTDSDSCGPVPLQRLPAPVPGRVRISHGDAGAQGVGQKKDQIKAALGFGRSHANSGEADDDAEIKAPVIMGLIIQRQLGETEKYHQRDQKTGYEDQRQKQDHARHGDAFGKPQILAVRFLCPAHGP